MASVAHLLCDAENIVQEIESRLLAAEECAVDNFLRAQLIQRIFRGYITRKHLELLHASAVIIQKNWRAFLGRALYRIRLKEFFDEMCWAYYNKMAKTIQKHWRGYWIRENKFSYYSLKSWLAFVAQQNKLLKCEVEASRNESNEAEMKQREEEAKEWIVYILFKLHHLLRTKQLSGIYSLPNTIELSEIEKMLKCLKYKDFMIFYNAYMEDVRQKKAKELPPFIFQQCKYEAHYEREYYEQQKLHKEYLFSREPYKSRDDEFRHIELRELKNMEKHSKPILKVETNINLCKKCLYKINKMQEINEQN